VEKWNSSNFIGARRGHSKGKQGAAKGYIIAQGRAHPTHGLRSRRGKLNQVAGMPAMPLNPEVALLQTPTAALSKLVVADKGGKR
jgi:hypothetical protein